jgi:hypothetical protein
MTVGGMTSAKAAIATGGGNTKQQSNKYSSNPRKKHISLLGGSSFINQMHCRGTKGLMRGVRGPILLATATVVMVVGCWSMDNYPGRHSESRSSQKH